MDNAKSLFDLKRIVVCHLILFVGRRKEVYTCLHTAQIEVEGNLLLRAAAECRRDSFCSDTISILVASHCYEVLAGHAELRPGLEQTSFVDIKLLFSCFLRVK